MSREARLARWISPILVSILFLGTLGVVVAQAQALQPPPTVPLPPAIQQDVAMLKEASTLPKAPEIPSQIFSGHVSESDLEKAVSTFLPVAMPYLDLSSHYNETFNQVMRDGLTGNSAAITHFLTQGEWEQIGLAILAGTAVVLACALSAGIVCFIVIVLAVVAVYLLAYFLSQITGAQGNAIEIGFRYLVSLSTAVNAIMAQGYSTLQVMDASMGTWAGMAEAAALAQLGSPWNPALDMLNSTLAFGFAGMEFALWSNINTQVQNTLNAFDSSFLGSNPGCGVDIGYATGSVYPSGGEVQTPNDGGADLCGSASTYSNQVIGSVEPLQLWGVPACSGTPSIATSTAALYVGANTTWGNGSLGTITLSAPYAVWGAPGSDIQVYSINGTHLGHTPAPATNGVEANWTFGGNGTYALTPEHSGYMLCATSGTPVIGLPASFPLNDATEMANVAGNVQTNPEQIGFFGDNPALGAGFGVTAFSSMGFVATADVGVRCVSLYGNQSGNIFYSNSTDPSFCAPANGNFGSNLTFSLYALAHTAVRFGEAYWAFLTYLGFSNANQLPTACLIPTPSQLMPSSIPWTQLKFLTVFQILVIYTSELAALDATFGNNTAPPAGFFTVCGITAPIIVCGPNPFGGGLNQTLIAALLSGLFPVDPSWWQCSFGLATQGIGYLFTGAHGTIGNNLTDARTWLFNGTLALLPKLGHLGPIPINQTWQMPTVGVNPVSAWVQPFINNATIHNQIAAADPYGCLRNQTSTTKAGNDSKCWPGDPRILGGTYGNSTLVNGSALGLNHTASPSTFAVFLVACEQVSGNSTIWNVSTTLTTTGKCNFGAFNWSWGGSFCDTHPNSTLCKTGCNPVTQNCCLINCVSASFCLTFPIISILTVAVGNAWPAILGGQAIGQALGCILGILLLVLIAVVVILGVIYVVRSATGGGRRAS